MRSVTKHVRVGLVRSQEGSKSHNNTCALYINIVPLTPLAEHHAYYHNKNKNTSQRSTLGNNQNSLSTTTLASHEMVYFRQAMLHRKSAPIAIDISIFRTQFVRKGVIAPSPHEIESVKDT